MPFPVFFAFPWLIAEAFYVACYETYTGQDYD